MSRLEPTNEASAMQKEISAIAEQGGGTTKVEQLIQQYCPDGVEYKRLGDVCLMERGTSATKGTMQEGDIPVISGGRQPAFYCSQSNREGETITVAGSGAGAGYVQYWDKPIFVCDAFSIKGNDSLNTKFIYYFLSSIQEKIYATKKGGGVPHVHISSIDKFEIPVPPLPVQEEIVRILDTLTELQAELQAELQKRLQQYNYYRDNLLSFEGRTDVEWKKLGDVCLMERGTSATKGTMQSGEIPVISGGRQPAFYCNQSNRTGETITVAGSGAGAGYVQYWNEPIFVCDAFSIKGNDGLMTKYIYYYLTSNQERIYATKKGGGVPHVHISSIDKFEIPVPPLPVQEEIVRILDRFDTLTTDITAGLPAEIEARRKQYEYYRDQLLTFKQKA